MHGKSTRATCIPHHRTADRKMAILSRLVPPVNTAHRPDPVLTLCTSLPSPTSYVPNHLAAGMNVKTTTSVPVHTRCPTHAWFSLESSRPMTTVNATQAAKP